MMRFPAPKGEIEAQALNLAFERAAKEWAFAPGFGPTQLLRHWQKFVQEVEEGYQLSIYDFQIDLEMRDVLEEIKASVPPRLRREIEAALQPWDERFELATRPINESIDAGAEGVSNSWWFRAPKHAGPEIERYLLERGL